jgi:hypothetical protein
MKILLFSLAVGNALAFASQAVCQDNKPVPERPYIAHTEVPRLYFSMPPTERMGLVELSAVSAQLTFSPERNLTSAEVDSLLQLSGDVRIRVCAPSNLGCEKWSIDMRADTVYYNEQTREINAHGDVRIEPFKSPQNAIFR